jgi:hypothetical protein
MIDNLTYFPELKEVKNKLYNNKVYDVEKLLFELVGKRKIWENFNLDEIENNLNNIEKYFQK